MVEGPNNPIKVKIEFIDNTGTKYSLNIEGHAKENINKLLDFAQSISVHDPTQDEMATDTNFAKLYGLLESRFRFGSFTSTDVLQAYQQDFKTTTTQSVISTYLSRMAQRRIVTRSRHGSGWIYKLARTEEQRQDLITQPTPSDLLKFQHVSP